MAKRSKSRREWARVVEKWKLSGLGVKEFCSREGVGESRFYEARKEVETGISRYEKSKEKDTVLSRPLFLPVKVQPSKISSVGDNNQHASHLMELTLNNGCSLRFPSTISPQALIKIANVLTNKTC